MVFSEGMKGCVVYIRDKPPYKFLDNIPVL